MRRPTHTHCTTRGAIICSIHVPFASLYLPAAAAADIPSAPGKPVLVHSDDSDSDAVTLKWERPRTDGGSPLHGYYVQHRRTGSAQWVNSTPALILYPEVVLAGLEPGWRYQFRVAAENAVGTSDYSELSEPLTVALQRNAAAAAPRFVGELPATTTVIENEKVEFRVTVAGQPAPVVNWFKDGFEVFSSRRTRIVTEAGCSTLTIHQTALTDEGEIKCTATNRLGHVVVRGALCIEAPPKIRLPRQYEDGLLIEADEVVRLKVGLAGRPAPMVVWCHNGEIIRNEPGSTHYEVQTSEKNSTLRIANSQRSDRGEYNLRAINKLGDDVVSFLVTVTDRPSRPGRVSVTMTLGKSVTLAWTAPDDDGGCKIGNYVVEYYRIGWNVWLKAVTTRQLSATLSDLIEGSEYKFRVKAESPYGMSDPSDESDVMFVPDPKRGLLNATGAMAAARSADSFEIAEQVSRIPVLTKPPLKSALKTTATTADKSASLPRTKGSPTTNPNKRLPAPKLYDSETIAREMSYGSAGASDTAVQAQQNQIRKRPNLNENDQQQLLKDMQYETGDDAFEQKQRRSSLRRDDGLAEATAQSEKQLAPPTADDNQENPKSNQTGKPCVPKLWQICNHFNLLSFQTNLPTIPSSIRFHRRSYPTPRPNWATSIPSRRDCAVASAPPKCCTRRPCSASTRPSNWRRMPPSSRNKAAPAVSNVAAPASNRPRAWQAFSRRTICQS